MDQSLKQRLVGALVFISLAIIFLPIIFDGQRTAIDSEPYNAPPKPKLKTATLNIKPIEDSARPIVNALDEIADDKDREVESNPQPQSVDQYIEEEEITDIAMRQSQNQPVALAEAWVLQMGAFKTEENADLLRNRLLEAGYKAYTKHIDGFYKVYVGPEIRNYRIGELKNRLEQEFDVKALILKYIP